MLSAVAIATVTLLGAALLVATRNDTPSSGADTSDGPVAGSGGNSLQVTATITVDRYPGGVAATDTAVWVTSGFVGSVTRIDPDTNEITATIPVDGNPNGVAATATAVWVSSGTLTRIGPDTNKITATIPVGIIGSEVAATATAVWVLGITNNGDDGVYDAVNRIDPGTE